MKLLEKLEEYDGKYRQLVQNVVQFGIEFREEVTVQWRVGPVFTCYLHFVGLISEKYKEEAIVITDELKELTKGWGFYQADAKQKQVLKISYGTECHKCKAHLPKEQYICFQCQPNLSFCVEGAEFVNPKAKTLKSALYHHHVLGRVTEDSSDCMDRITYFKFRSKFVPIKDRARYKNEDGALRNVTCRSCQRNVKDIFWICANCDRMHVCQDCFETDEIDVIEGLKRDHNHSNTEHCMLRVNDFIVF